MMNRNAAVIFLFFSYLLLVLACNESEKSQPIVANDSITEEKETSKDADKIGDGKKYVAAARTTIGNNLMNAISSSGSDGAITFCSLKAIQLTDSLSSEFGVSLRRITDQPRNPLNLAANDEMSYILQAKDSLAAGKQVEPFIINHDTKSLAYYPILTNIMCLQCHGKPTIDIEEKTFNKLASLYPNDKATGYGENELRGFWVVEMPK